MTVTGRGTALTDASQGPAVDVHDSLASRRLVRSDAVAVGMLLILVAVVAWVRLWLRPGLGDWDIMTFYLPWYGFLGDHVRHFDIPGWNPYIFSGNPFAGNPQSGWTYLPAMVLFAILPAVPAFKVFIAFHFALGGVAAYVLARLLGVRTLGALAGGIVFGLGQNVGASDCCTNHLQLANWLPVALIGVELAQRTCRLSDRLAALALGAVAVSQMVAGWLGQGTYYAALIIGSYLVVRTVVSPLGIRPEWRRRITNCAIDGAVISGLGLGLAAAGLLPRLDVVRRTYVGGDEYQGAYFDPDRGWGWGTVLRVTTGYRPEWHPLYVGGAALALAILALLAVRRYSIVLYFAAFVAVVVILPLHPTPLHDLFYLLPRFRGLHLHDPGRVFAVLPLGMSMLVAIAIDSLPGYLRQRWAPALPLVSLSLLAYLIASTSNSWQPIAGVTTVALISISVLLAVAILGLRTGKSGCVSPPTRIDLIVAISIIVVIFSDPTGFSLAWPDVGPRDESSERTVRDNIPDSVFRSAISQNASRSDPDGAGEFLQNRQATDGEMFRYFGYVAPNGGNWQEHEHYMEADDLAVLTNGRSIRLGLQEVQGYDPAHLDRYRVFFEALNGFSRDYHEELVYASGITSPLLDLLNVRYIVVPNEDPAEQSPPELAALLANYPEVFRNDNVRVLENGDALPRAWIVHEAQTVTPTQALDLLASGKVDPRQEALLEASPPQLSNPADASTESVSVSTYEDKRIVLNVDANSDGLVVLSEVDDPGWRVYLDGNRTELYAVDYLLRGAAVPAGHHVIEFRYEPSSLRIGTIASIVSFLLVSGIGAFCLLSRRVCVPRTAA
jgi:hypothetical protein